MKTTTLALWMSLLALPLGAQGAPPQGGANHPYTMEYYYKVQWGHQQEFLQLFLKNHYPLLQKEVETGRILAVRIETPANHMTEESRWDYRVTLTFRNSTMATTTNPDEQAMIKQLWPDQGVFTREEQRRFEVLAAHRDLPVTDITAAERWLLAMGPAVRRREQRTRRRIGPGPAIERATFGRTIDTANVSICRF